MSHIFCVCDTYKKVAELYIIMEIWVFQLTHVESRGCPAGGAVLITAITVYDHRFDQLFLFRCKQNFLSPK